MKAIQFPEQKELEIIIWELQVFMDISAVTLHEANTAGKSGYILMIILEEDSNQIATEMYQWADKVFKRHFEITYRIINIRDVLHQLKHGNLFFIKWYLGSTYLCRSEEFDFKIKQLPKAKELLKKTIKKNTRLLAKAEALRRGAQHYTGTNSHQLGLVTIVQAINLLLGVIGELVMGKMHTKMHIFNHMELIKNFAPVVSDFFDSHNNQDVQLAKLLDDSYRDSPHSGKTKIIKESIVKAQNKLQVILTETKKIYKEQLAYCEGEVLRFVDPVPAGSILEVNELCNETIISHIIRAYLKTAAIYCFDKREATMTHYFLLVLVEESKENAVHDLVDIIKSKTNGKCTATLLIHKVSELQTSSEDQRYFFWNVLDKGLCLYQNQQINLTVLEANPRRHYESAKAYLQCRNVIVNSMESWQENDQGAGYSPLTGVMLGQLIEQMCLGMIRLFMGYSPNHFSLAYLLEICDFFDPLTGSFFPRQTKEDITLFRLLSSSYRVLRYSGYDQFSDKDKDLLGKRYVDFSYHCKEIVKNELERIET
jgi:hypothetical protein